MFKWVIGLLIVSSVLAGCVGFVRGGGGGERRGGGQYYHHHDWR